LDSIEVRLSLIDSSNTPIALELRFAQLGASSLDLIRRRCRGVGGAGE
jgi:hypothetical protein